MDKIQNLLLFIGAFENKELQAIYYQYFKDNFLVVSDDTKLEEFKNYLEKKHLENIMRQINTDPCNYAAILEFLQNQKIAILFNPENQQKIIFLERIYLSLHCFEQIKNQKISLIERIVYFVLFFLISSPQRKAQEKQTELFYLLLKFNTEGPSDYLKKQLSAIEESNESLYKFRPI